MLRPYSVQAARSGAWRAARSSSSLNGTRGYGTHDGMSQRYSSNQDCCQDVAGRLGDWAKSSDVTVALLPEQAPAMHRHNGHLRRGRRGWSSIGRITGATRAGGEECGAVASLLFSPL